MSGVNDSGDDQHENGRDDPGEKPIHNTNQSAGEASSSSEKVSVNDSSSSNNIVVADGKRHQKRLSWSPGVLFNDALGGGNMDSPQRPPLPPPLPPAALPPPSRRHSTEDYQIKNQKFVQQAVAASLKNARSSSSPTTSTKQHHHTYSPSPNTTFRKRLHLKSIEEDDGQNSLVILNQNQQQQQPSNAHIPQQQQQQHQPTDFITTTSIKFQEPFEPTADDVSVLSSLAGSYVGSPSHQQLQLQQWMMMMNGGGGGGNSANDNTNMIKMGPPPEHLVNYIDNNNHNSEMQRLTKFEEVQNERFQQSKQEIQRKLAMNDYTNEFIQSYMEDLERERATMLAEWKKEMLMEEERIRQEGSRQRLLRDCYEACCCSWVVDSVYSFLANAEVVLSNMPLTIGALGLSWVTMGVVWFKFTEEMVSTCEHVHYFSNLCTFREFPGCFECDVNNLYYKVALYFHWFCSSVAALSCILFITKVILAPQVVWDMLKNPTTSTPAGVFCIAMVCTFAGYGLAGETIVLITSCFHVVLAFWFLWMAFIQFRLWPDPGWFPNVVGISYAGVKTFIYYPTPGLILMSLCTLFFLATFFVSVSRVYLNHKIAAPVCWIQLSAPSITLYALTLISQPTRHEELFFESSLEAKQHYHHLLTTYFLPSQHFFMALTMVGLISAVHSLYVRWPTFKTKAFSPAHVAFCFPTLSHTNAIQAYRGSLNAYSSMPPDCLFKRLLFGYWCFFLFTGTILNIVFTIKYIVRIPEWTRPDLTGGEEQPPDPSHTVAHEMMGETGLHESMQQPFISPAVLEANEAGVLVRNKRGSEAYRLHGPFMRTRNVSSLGFDLILSEMELREERARLLDWCARNGPRSRNRTMSDVPGHLYGTFSDQSLEDTLVRGHTRSKTAIGTSNA